MFLSSIHKQEVWIENTETGVIIIIPFEEWNRIIQQIGERKPQADRINPP